MIYYQNLMPRQFQSSPSGQIIPEEFWNARAGRFGHTGWADALIYAFDQAARLKSLAD